ncbi:MAG: hypothetical protein NTY64_09200, partial [Deltaproteobacteria bacterium]|nr:hypothetical protein [Deltaproteobacteria bacterium]
AAGVGFDVAVVERAERLRRRWKGIATFFLAAFTEFLRYRFPDISLDGGEWKYRGPAWQAIFTKIPRYALLLRIPSSIQMDDGLMTVCFIPPIAKMKVFYLFPFLGMGR